NNEKTRNKLKKKAFTLLKIYTILLIILYIIFYILKLSIVKSIIVSFMLGLFLQIVVLTNIGTKFINLLDKVFVFFINKILLRFQNNKLIILKYIFRKIGGLKNEFSI